MTLLMTYVGWDLGSDHHMAFLEPCTTSASRLLSPLHTYHQTNLQTLSHGHVVIMINCHIQPSTWDLPTQHTYLVVNMELLHQIQFHEHTYAGLECVVVIEEKVAEVVVKELIILCGWNGQFLQDSQLVVGQWQLCILRWHWHVGGCHALLSSGGQPEEASVIGCSRVACLALHGPSAC